MAKYIQKLGIILIIVAVLTSVNIKADAAPITLPQFAKALINGYLEGNDVSNNLALRSEDVPKSFKGIFVTAFGQKNKVRGCWGDLYPQGNFKETLQKAAIHAVKSDYRYKPIGLTELPTLKMQVSVVTQIRAIDSYRELNPFADGVLVVSGSKTAVILPGEAIDPYYQVLMAKRKAGIQVQENFGLYRLSTIIYRE